MANMIKKQEFGGPNKQILIAEDSYKVTLGAVISDTGAEEVDGKKILRAGTPVKGDLKARTTAFTKEANAPTAVLLHDVDVTNGKANGTIVVAGVVDLNRLDATTAALITETVETALPKIIFIK